MDDFNAELLSSQEERHEVDRVLRGATEEYHRCRQVSITTPKSRQEIDDVLVGPKMKPLCPECGCTVGLGDGCVRCHTSDDRYILHGVFARLIAVHTEVDDAWDDHEIAAMYDTVVHELINTLTSYLSQG